MTDTRQALAALMGLAAECAQRKPLRAFEDFTEATHIGHRQFGRAYERADEDVRMLAVRLRAVFDALAPTLSAQPVAGAVAPEREFGDVRYRGIVDAVRTQAAPAPEPSAQAVAHPSHQTVREWMPVSEALRLSDLWTAGDLDNCGQWRAAIKVLADEVRALAASPQPEPSAQAKKMVSDFARACVYGSDDERIAAGRALELALASAPSSPPHANDIGVKP